VTDDLLFGRYSERYIRFLLLHWDVWASAGEYPAYARDAMQLARREWEHLREYPDLDCMCAELNDGISSREAFGARGPAGPRFPLLLDVRVELAQALDALPLPWLATRRLYAVLGRDDVWAARLAQHRQMALPNPRDRLREPPSDPQRPWLRTGSGAACVRLMTAYLDERHATSYGNGTAPRRAHEHAIPTP
jgi:hypothetical protein